MTRRGLFLAIFDELSDPRVVAELAHDAEEAGWDGVFVWDHLLYSPPVQAIADPWITCAAIAMATRRVLFGPMVTPLSRRRPHVLARQALSLDRLSQGRLVLGFGLGDDGASGELSRFGEQVEPQVRAAMLDEGLEVLGGLFSGEQVTHDGPHHTARGVRFLPGPTRPEGIPVWLAGRYPGVRPLQRAARHDGAFVISIPEPADLTTVRRTVEAARGTLDGFDVVVDLPAGVDPAPWADAGATWVLTRIGPYDIDLAATRRLARARPS